mmetsp:Transcript_27766/g.32390  ORF Transcript_27766/g.32390 Transcript_27766/m.32390 type:complete len:195 (+) Transcript_27766:44-628(+)
MKVFSLSYFVLLLSLFAFTVAADEADEEDDSVLVSAECAAVLVVAGGAVGGTASWALASSVLYLIGFTAEGVAAGSFASWWQSTMPLISAGSLFASLQSIAMTGVANKVIVSGAIGGAATAQRFKDVCSEIDEVDPNSTGGKTIAAILKAEHAAYEVGQKAGATWSAIKNIFHEQGLFNEGTEEGTKGASRVEV